MNNLLQRLKDWYSINVKDNAVVFMNEHLYAEIPRNIEEVKAASRRQDERKYNTMRIKFNNCAQKCGEVLN